MILPQELFTRSLAVLAIQSITLHRSPEYPTFSCFRM